MTYGPCTLAAKWLGNYIIPVDSDWPILLQLPLYHKQRLLPRDYPRLSIHRLAQELGDGEHAPVRDAGVRESP